MFGCFKQPQLVFERLFTGFPSSGGFGPESVAPERDESSSPCGPAVRRDPLEIRNWIVMAGPSGSGKGSSHNDE